MELTPTPLERPKRARDRQPWRLYQDSRKAALSLPHREYNRAQLLLFAGKREMGKTTALKTYVESCEPRVFCLDPFGDFDGIRARENLSTALDEFKRSNGEPIRRRVVPPIDASSIDYADNFFGAAIDSLRDCLLVLDEITLWSHRTESPAFRTLVLQGRRLGLRLAVACQRIALVPGVLLAESTEMILFRMTRPRDLDTVDDWAGQEVREKVSGLRQGECVILAL